MNSKGNKRVTLKGGRYPCVHLFYQLYHHSKCGKVDFYNYYNNFVLWFLGSCANSTSANHLLVQEFSQAGYFPIQVPVMLSSSPHKMYSVYAGVRVHMYATCTKTYHHLFTCSLFMAPVKVLTQDPCCQAVMYLLGRKNYIIMLTMPKNGFSASRRIELQS